MKTFSFGQIHLPLILVFHWGFTSTNFSQKSGSFFDYFERSLMIVSFILRSRSHDKIYLSICHRKVFTFKRYSDLVTCSLNSVRLIEEY